MAITVTDSFLTEKAMDYAKLSDLAYAQWNNSVLVAGQPDYDDYLKLWRELSAKGYTLLPISDQQPVILVFIFQ